MAWAAVWTLETCSASCLVVVGASLAAVVVSVSFQSLDRAKSWDSLDADEVHATVNTNV